jgi:hypothetical protein
MSVPPERQTSAAPISVTYPPINNKGSVKVNEDIAKAQANAVTMNEYLPIRSPDASNPVTIEGFMSGPAQFHSGSIALSVIGILCIVYGIVAK